MAASVWGHQGDGLATLTSGIQTAEPAQKEVQIFNLYGLMRVRVLRTLVGFLIFFPSFFSRKIILEKISFSLFGVLINLIFFAGFTGK